MGKIIIELDEDMLTKAIAEAILKGKSDSERIRVIEAKTISRHLRDMLASLPTSSASIESSVKSVITQEVNKWTDTHSQTIKDAINRVWESRVGYGGNSHKFGEGLIAHHVQQYVIGLLLAKQDEIKKFVYSSLEEVMKDKIFPTK